ncbi:hypothetical protein [Streptomyces sp. NBC_00203]|uniref:hypothetical protein n=1 Tax=Streptomyces sp. NBC_00203 TaxID=2975680 RepID=UPI0032489C4F
MSARNLRLQRTGVIVGAVSALLLVLTPSAFADWTWTSYISSWTDGDTSHRWDDEAYNEISWEGCYAQYGTTQQTVVKRRIDVSLASDVTVDTFTFSNCFNGSGYYSTDTQTGLDSASYYFEADKVAQGGSCCLLFADWVGVDTTQAD